MPAYMIFSREGRVTDQAEMDIYSAAMRVHGAMFKETYKMKPVVIYGAMETFEGAAPDGVVMLEFPTTDDARNWYRCDEYQAALAHRHKGATYRVTLVEGL